MHSTATVLIQTPRLIGSEMAQIGPVERPMTALDPIGLSATISLDYAGELGLSVRRLHRQPVSVVKSIVAAHGHKLFPIEAACPTYIIANVCVPLASY